MSLKCLVITDIHGLPQEETCFLSGFEISLSIKRIGLAELLGRELQGEELYQLLLDGGFETAAAKVRDLFGETEIALGYSSGGAVLWKSVLMGLPLKRLACISSTRLRDEDPHAMEVPTLTIFGDRDEARPSEDWGDRAGLERLLLPQAEHAFYCSKDANWVRGREAVVNFLLPVGSEVSTL